MSPSRLFLDTMVLAYAVGGDHPERAPCRAILAEAAEAGVELHASVEAVQEFLFHRLRREARTAAVRQTERIRDLLVLHPFDRDVVDRMLTLVEGCGIGGRDAVHAATALHVGFGSIVSTDQAFDVVPGLTRLAPASALRAA